MFAAAERARNHAKYLQKIMGGWHDMPMYVHTFGELDPHPPTRRTFSRMSFSPPRWMVEEFFGATVYCGLGARLQIMQQGNGKGVPFRVLAGAYIRGEAHNALVWVSDSFSRRNMLTAPGDNDGGFWYPCLVAVDDFGFVVFLCPRLALDGTKCWVAHPTRIILFIAEQGIELIDREVLCTVEEEEVDVGAACPRKKGEKKEEGAISAASTTPPSTHQRCAFVHVVECRGPGVHGLAKRCAKRRLHVGGRGVGSAPLFGLLGLFGLVTPFTAV